jgi:hypothetical protein
MREALKGRKERDILVPKAHNRAGNMLIQSKGRAEPAKTRHPTALLPRKHTEFGAWV